MSACRYGSRSSSTIAGSAGPDGLRARRAGRHIAGIVGIAEDTGGELMVETSDEILTRETFDALGLAYEAHDFDGGADPGRMTIADVTALASARRAATMPRRPGVPQAVALRVHLVDRPEPIAALPSVSRSPAAGSGRSRPSDASRRATGASPAPRSRSRSRASRRPTSRRSSRRSRTSARSTRRASSRASSASGSS